MIEFTRLIRDKVRTLVDGYPVFILTGARQTGKTTLLKKTFPSFSYITLDLPSLAELAESDPESFLAQYPAPLLIDAAQYAPKLFRHLKLVVDKHPHLKGQYILTGSQKFNLMKDVGESLAGRCAWAELEGLSMAELNTVSKFETIESYTHMMFRGTMPKLWQQPELSPTDYYRSYMATYLERDVRQLVNIGSLRDFERFMRICATRSGQLLNKSNIAKSVGISINTVNQWLSVLIASNQIHLLEPHFINLGKRLVKSPKLYFANPGLLCFLLGVDQSSLLNTPYIGHIWETLVYSELRKYQLNQTSNAKLWFYRDNANREVDFIWEEHGKLDFIEVKWSQAPKVSDTKNLQAILEDTQKNTSILSGQPYIICRTPSSYKIKDTHICQIHSFLQRP